MAWGYWSATSVSDRGRSPRREKDKQQHQSLHQQQQQYQQTEIGVVSQGLYSAQQVQGELAGVGTSSVVTGVNTAVEEPPCSMMIQGGSFYSYSAATAAAAAVGRNRIIASVDGGPSTSSTGIQILPRERSIKSCTSTYPPSPSSDSAEYEQPLMSPRTKCSPHNSPRDDVFLPPGGGITNSAKIKLLYDKGIDDTSEIDIDEVAATEMMYATAKRAIGISMCRVHGPCNPPPDSAPPMPPSLIDDTSGPSQFWFNDITWVFPNVPSAPGMPCQGEDTSVLRVLPRSDLGTRSAGIQVYPMQATGTQEMSQSGTQTMLERATTTTATTTTATATTDTEHGIADDRQERRSTTA